MKFYKINSGTRISFISWSGFVFFMSITVFGISCKKNIQEPALQPEVRIIDMERKTLNANRNYFAIDFNGDHNNDLLFWIQNIAYDMNTKTRMEFKAFSTGTSRLAVNTLDDSTVALKYGDTVPFTDFSPYEWFKAASIVLMKKEISAGSKEENWNGSFLSPKHRFLPFHIYQDNKIYTAWMELETDTKNEQVVLLRAAIAVNPDQSIAAGY